MASTRNATRRLLREFESWQAEQEELVEARRQRVTELKEREDEKSKTENGDDLPPIRGGEDQEEDDNNPNRGIERLGPAADAGDLFHWEAVLNGRGVGGGYDDGRWLLQIDLPAAYPLQPPTVRFATPVMHANVHPTTGEVCLDLLQSAWTPTLTVAACVRAVRLLLSNPGLDSPLNVDLAVLLRNGDRVGAARLVQLWSEERRYEGI